MTESDECTASLEDEGGHPVLTLRGTVDVRCARELHQLALSAAERDCDVHVVGPEVERLEASALQILIALREALGERGHELHFGALSAAAEGAIRMAGLEESFLGARDDAPVGVAVAS